jgi:hypothetical protein
MAAGYSRVVVLGDSAIVADWFVAAGTLALAGATAWLGLQARHEGSEVKSQAEAVRKQADAVTEQVKIGREQTAAILEQVQIGREQVEAFAEQVRIAREQLDLMRPTPRLVLGKPPVLADKQEEVGAAGISVIVLPCFIELVNAGSGVAIITAAEVRWRNAGAYATLFPSAIPAGASGIVRGEFMLTEYLVGEFAISVQYRDADGRTYAETFAWDMLAGTGRWTTRVLEQLP